MRNIHMDKNPVKQSAKIIVANAKAKLTKLKNNQPHPTTEIKIETKRKLTSGEIKMCQLVLRMLLITQKYGFISEGIFTMRQVMR